MRRRARTSLLPVAALALVLAVASPGTAQSPMLPATSAPSPWATQVILIVQLSGADGGSPTAAQVAEAESVVRSRLAALGVPRATVRDIPDDRLRIDLADAVWADAVRDVATAPGDLEFVPVPDAYSERIVPGAPLPAGMSAQPLFGGDSIATLELGQDMVGQPAIWVQLDPAAAQAFDDYARGHYQGRFAIVLDGTVPSAPSINATEFNGRAQISGDFDLQGTQELIAILEGGVLPATAEIVNLCPVADECPAPTIGPAVSPGA